MATAILDETRSAGNSDSPVPLTPISTLPFNDFPVPLYEHEDQTWIAGLDLGRCLGYKNPSGAILNIFNRHKDELDPLSTHLILRGEGGKIRTQRAYNEQGAYIVAMFATTPEAKDVRLWLAKLPRRMREVMCVIRQQTPAPAPTLPATLSTSSRLSIQNLIAAKVSHYPSELRPKAFKEAWSRVKNKFQVAKYEEIPQAVYPDVVSYILAMEMRTGLPAGEQPKALPAAAERFASIRDYASIFRGLPDKLDYWNNLSRRLGRAHDAFQNELEAIKKEALRPFRENRRIEVATFLDFATVEGYRRMFDIAEDGLLVAYRGVYGALVGLESLHELLVHGQGGA